MLKFGNTFVNFDETYLTGWKGQPNYNPLNLPPNTVRVRTSDGNVPKKFTNRASYETATLVHGTTDVYDVYKSGQSFKNLLYDSSNVVEVLGANTTGIAEMLGMFRGCNLISTVPLFDTSNVTQMSNMFYYCKSLSTVPLFDTSKVTSMNSMFDNCTSLTNIPLFDTSNVGYVTYMFRNCTSVQSGALAFYQQASTQTNPPISHNQTFRNCGSNTQTGAAELAQIPSDWK